MSLVLFNGRKPFELLKYSHEKKCDEMTLESGPFTKVVSIKDQTLEQMKASYSEAINAIGHEKLSCGKRLYNVLVVTSREDQKIAQAVWLILIGEPKG